MFHKYLKELSRDQIILSLSFSALMILFFLHLQTRLKQNKYQLEIISIIVIVMLVFVAFLFW